MSNYEGWGCVSLMIDMPLEHIDNPRPIFLKAREENKSLLAHFCTSHGKAACGKAYLPHTGRFDATMNEYWKPTFMKLENEAVICPECKEIFLKEFDEYGIPLNSEDSIET